MPFVRIDTLKDHYNANQLAAMGGAVQQSLHVVGVPPAEKFQIFTARSRIELVFDATYLGVERTEGFVAVQITLNLGRTPDDKRRLYAALASNMTRMAGVLPEDLFINLIEVTRENWSFGNGEAQLA